MVGGSNPSTGTLLKATPFGVADTSKMATISFVSTLVRRSEAVTSWAKQNAVAQEVIFGISINMLKLYTDCSFSVIPSTYGVHTYWTIFCH